MNFKAIIFFSLGFIAMMTSAQDDGHPDCQIGFDTKACEVPLLGVDGLEFREKFYDR